MSLSSTADRHCSNKCSRMSSDRNLVLDLSIHILLSIYSCNECTGVSTAMSIISMFTICLLLLWSIDSTASRTRTNWSCYYLFAAAASSLYSHDAIHICPIIPLPTICILGERLTSCRRNTLATKSSWIIINSILWLQFTDHSLPIFTQSSQ